ncbi:hypothetical protein MKZ38_001428 [Zalerion maritima]|uniref:FAD-binding FR-type domain-containing protein n=1 Tax=Zalerion maritima TaxID=339359 RepID=A0AAD5RRS0_9PEZI|nr:hypothetical protein MKZ38_001428 [Zalerion maritima]
MSAPGAWGGGGSGHGGSSANQDTAAQAQAEAKAKMFEERQQANQEAMKYFAAGVCGIIAIVALLHWTRRLFVGFERAHNAKKPPVWALPIVVVARKLRQFSLRRMPPFESAARFILIITYVGLNAVLLVTHIDTSSYATVAGNRAGWLAVGNLCVVVFLALKHTPMSPLSRISYEKLNPIHQLAGFFTIGLTIMHGVAYAVYFMSQDRAEMLRRPTVVSGIVAGFAMTLMGVVPLLTKTRFYEFFYIAHILTFIALIVATALHQPKTAEKMAIMTIVAGGIWAVDRIARFARIALNSFGNSATLYPLPAGGTRVILKRSPFGTTAGKHVFLWLPSISMFQTHPFSVVSVEDGQSEFVILSRRGFTAALHAHAQKHPGASIRASADGAYGAFPSPDSRHFDKVILVAGGSGASFTFGLVGNLLSHMETLASRASSRNEEAKTLDVDFIWAVRGQENLSWFAPSLRRMRNHPQAPNVNVSLHVTRLPSENSASGGETDEAPVLPDPEKLAPLASPLEDNGQHHELRASSSSSRTPASSDRNSACFDEKQLEAGLAATATTTAVHGDPRPGTSESGASSSCGSIEGHLLRPGRPDVAYLIDRAVEGTDPSKTVLIAACGPGGLTKVVREAAARNIRASGPGVELHSEVFGW